MSIWMRQKERNAVAIRRRRPGIVRLAQIPYEGIDLKTLVDSDPPTELHMEATGPDGEVAFWLDDFFWLELIQRWPTVSLAIHFRPSPGAFLHPVITHQLNMLHRVAPTWRLIGHCSLGELTGEGWLVQAAQSAYHEIHVHEPLPQNSDVETDGRGFDHAMERILDIQATQKRSTPILVRCRPTPTPTPPPREGLTKRVPNAPPVMATA